VTNEQLFLVFGIPVLYNWLIFVILYSRLGSIGCRFAGIGGRLSGLDARVANLEQTMVTRSDLLFTKMDSVDARLSRLLERGTC